MNELTKNNIKLINVTNEEIATKRIIEVLDIVELDYCSTILDIGSWHLKQSIELAKIFNKAQIYAFEPNPPAFDLCEKTKKQLPHELKNRINIIKKAASNKNSEISFYALDQEKTNSSNLGMSSINKLVEGFDGSLLNDYWVQKEIKVSSIRLDDWLKENKIKDIDILWMDVQGSENLVLEGFGDMLSKIKIIFTEAGVNPYYENHCLKKDLDKILEKNFICLEDKTKLVSWASEKASEADVIYVNKKFFKGTLK